MILKKLSYWVYRLFCGLVRLFYRRPELFGLDNLPDGPCVIVGNHAQMNGPIVAELYLPGDRAIWCNGEMMHLREVPDYAFMDFWSLKPRGVRWFYRLLSYIIAPLSVCLFNNAHCIGVYRDMRVMGTMRKTVERLSEGARVVIFPERDEPCNNILCAFQDRFVDLARIYRHQTGQALCFVPMYVAPSLRRVIFGPPVAADPDVPANAERACVCRELTERITRIARSQPRHRVVPYLNIARRDYPYNDDFTDAND